MVYRFTFPKLLHEANRICSGGLVQRLADCDVIDTFRPLIHGQRFRRTLGVKVRGILDRRVATAFPPLEGIAVVKARLLAMVIVPSGGRF